MNRERAPFVLTPDFEYVMGKRVSWPLSFLVSCTRNVPPPVPHLSPISFPSSFLPPQRALICSRGSRRRLLRHTWSFDETLTSSSIYSLWYTQIALSFSLSSQSKSEYLSSFLSSSFSISTLSLFLPTLTSSSSSSSLSPLSR